jgi:hypothetical protein
MGLPKQAYGEFLDYFVNISDSTAVCASVVSNDGACTLPDVCASYSFLEEYTFQLVFASQPTFMLRIPLVLFTETIAGKCRVLVRNLTNSDHVVLGGLFF